MSDTRATIRFTYTDEAPALASFSLLPILTPIAQAPVLILSSKTFRLRDAFWLSSRIA